MWQRVDSNYKRNYKDYFEFIEGGLQAKEEGKLSEAEKGILDWLKANKWSYIYCFFSSITSVASSNDIQFYTLQLDIISM